MANKRTKQQKQKKRQKQNEMKRQKQRFKARHGKPRSQIQQLTSNAKMICELMESEGVKGNYKDYVVIVRDQMMDWAGEYELKMKDGKRVGSEEILLIHKRKLHNIIGDEAAKVFWHPRLGRLGAIKSGIPIQEQAKTSRA